MTPVPPDPTRPAAYRAAGEPCTAEAFYALACDPARSVAVEACAGSGKTWILVSRIVRALLDGTPPQDILALTFTRKAAGEMRERLQQELETWATCEPGRRVHDLVQRGLGRDRAQALESALAGLQERLAATGREPAVLTINGWFMQLLSQAPMELALAAGLSADWTPMEEIEPLLPALWRRFHRWIQGDPERRDAHRRLLQRHPQDRLEGWWRALLANRSEVERADAAGTLAGSVPPASACWTECAGVADPAELLDADPMRRSQLRAVIQALAADHRKKHRDLADALSAAMARTDPGLRFDALWNALHTDKGQPLALASVAPTSELLEVLRPLRRWRRQHLAAQDHRALLQLGRGLLEQWRQLKRERRVFDMVDLEQFAYRLLNDPVASGWVQQRLDQRWRRVLVDEFQDTSALQWQALNGWLSAYAGAGGGQALSLFVVGDPKQSIYRFRRAEPLVFQAATELIVQGMDGVRLECDHSRRCAPAVLDLVNAVFAPAQASGEWGDFRSHSSGRVDATGEARTLLRQERLPSAGGGRAAPIWNWRDSLVQPKREPREPLRLIEAGRVADAVRALAGERGLAWSQILVLSHRRERLGAIAQQLRQRGVPCVAGEKLPLTSLPEVGDLLAVLDLLASPGHDLSLAQALRSAAFGADDAAVHSLARRARRDGSTWAEALMIWERPPAPLDRAQAMLRGWWELARRLAPHDLLDRVVADSDFLQRAMARAQPHRREMARCAVQALLRQALQQDGGRSTSLYLLVRQIRQAGAQLPVPPQWDAVRLMTIHGAKGLEAPAVFLVDSDPEAPKPGRPHMLVDWPVAQAAPRRVAFVAGAEDAAPSLDDLRAEDERARARERLNLLYVALTRARDWLVVSATAPHRPDLGPSWWQRVQGLSRPWQPDPPAAGRGDLEADAQQPTAAAALAAAVVPVPVLPRREPAAEPDSPVPVAEEPTRSALPDHGDDAARRLGIAWHRLMEWALRPGARPLPELVAAAAQMAGLDNDGRDRLAANGRRLLDDPRLSAWLDAASPGAANEVELVVDGEVLRLDRLVALPGEGRREWWVIDYKLAGADRLMPAWRDQLARYRAAVATLMPGEVVRAAVITAAGELIELPP